MVWWGFFFAAQEGHRGSELTEEAKALRENQEGQGWTLKDREGQQREELSAGHTWGSLPSGVRQFTAPPSLPHPPAHLSLSSPVGMTDD